MRNNKLTLFDVICVKYDEKWIKSRFEKTVIKNKGTTYPIYLRLWCLHQRLEYNVEVLLEIQAEGQRDVPEDWEYLRLDHSMHIVVAKVLQQDGHDFVAVGGDDRTESAANVTDKTDSRVTNLNRKYSKSNSYPFSVLISPYVAIA